jgi:hypothetical protein
MGEACNRFAASPSSDGQSEDLAMNASVIHFHVPRIVAEPGASGWLVILGSFGWLFGSRREALSAARELAREVRQ